MICGRPIRRLTADERVRLEAQHAERYEALYAEIEAAEREEYDREFGPLYKSKYPYKPNGQRTHFKVLDRMNKESQ